MPKGKKDLMIVGRTGNNRQLHGRFIKGVVRVNGKNVILSKFFFALQTFFLHDGVRLLPLYLRWTIRIQIAHIRVRFNIIYTCHKGIIQWHHYSAQCTFEKCNNSFVKSVCLWCVKTSATHKPSEAKVEAAESSQQFSRRKTKHLLTKRWLNIRMCIISSQ